MVRWQDLTTFLSDTNRQKWWDILMDAHRNRPFRQVQKLRGSPLKLEKFREILQIITKISSYPQLFGR